MPLLKTIKEAVNGGITVKCPICGAEYKYPRGGYGGIYIPKTCGKFECEYKYQHQHPELSKERR